jgi:hypothetical protein
MTEAECDRIKAEAQATLTRLAGLGPHSRVPRPRPVEQPRPAELPPIEDPMTTWRREAAEREERVAASKRAMGREEDAMRDWRLKAELEQMLAVQKDLVIEAVGTFLGESLEKERQASALQIAELKAELAKVRTELAELKLSVATAGDRRGALDMSNPLGARTRVN